MPVRREDTAEDTTLGGRAEARTPEGTITGVTTGIRRIGRFWSELEVYFKTVVMSENLGTVGAKGFQAILDEANFSATLEMPVLPLDQLELLDVFLDPSPPARNQEEGLWEDKGEMLLKIPDLPVSFDPS